MGTFVISSAFVRRVVPSLYSVSDHPHPCWLDLLVTSRLLQQAFPWCFYTPIQTPCAIPILGLHVHIVGFSNCEVGHPNPGEYICCLPEKLAVVEADLLPEFKASCLKTFEAKKFDKVKSVREMMNQIHLRDSSRLVLLDCFLNWMSCNWIFYTAPLIKLFCYFNA